MSHHRRHYYFSHKRFALSLSTIEEEEDNWEESSLQTKSMSVTETQPHYQQHSANIHPYYYRPPPLTVWDSPFGWMPGPSVPHGLCQDAPTGFSLLRLGRRRRHKRPKMTRRQRHHRRQSMSDDDFGFLLHPVFSHISAEAAE